MTQQPDQTPKTFTHFWEHTVGSGHAPLALRADWQHQGNVTPPRDYDQWATLIDKLGRHWVDRYGRCPQAKP